MARARSRRSPRARTRSTSSARSAAGRRSRTTRRCSTRSATAADRSPTSDAFTAALDGAPGRAARVRLGRRRRPAEEAPQMKLEWVAGAVDAREEGAEATFVTRVSRRSAGAAYESEWVDKAPADALAFLSFDVDSFRFPGLGDRAVRRDARSPDRRPARGDRRRGCALGARRRRAARRSRSCWRSRTPARAQATLRQLLRDVPLELKFGVVDGVLVATTASSPAAAVQASGDKLGGSPDFEERPGRRGCRTRRRASCSSTSRTRCRCSSSPRFSAPTSRPGVLENLRPVRSVVGWSEVDGNVATQHLFVEIQ